MRESGVSFHLRLYASSEAMLRVVANSRGWDKGHESSCDTHDGFATTESVLKVLTTSTAPSGTTARSFERLVKASSSPRVPNLCIDRATVENKRVATTDSVWEMLVTRTLSFVTETELFVGLVEASAFPWIPGLILRLVASQSGRHGDWRFVQRVSRFYATVLEHRYMALRRATACPRCL